MRVKLLQTGAHAPWQVDEIITVQVVAVDDVGAYECETMDTYPPGLREQHQAELAQAHADYQGTIAELRVAHAAEVDKLEEK